MQFDSLLGALKTGKIDIIISVYDNNSRTKKVDFTKPYMITNNVMMIKKDDAKRYQNIKDFEGKKLLRKRDRSRKIAQTEIEDSKISSLNRLPEAILSLKVEK